ncbi:hypothetical protein [Absidia glauca]|uniref:Symplekin/Pta1 N-terminal domain-containing protein n=1 Tax=Absidia glauca TaxID=4829 RepID=A0A168LV80_ABSGL|nr:hypothetical protein [Absidia glauca]
MFLQPNVKQHKPSSTKKSVSSSSLPVIKTESSSAAISASELKLSNAMENRSQPLASTEERANQSFRMQPYNLADLQPVPEDQQLKLLAMSKQRLLAADYFTQGLQSSPTNISKRAVGATYSVPRLLTWDSTTKIFWAALISKIFTFSAPVNDHGSQIPSTSSSSSSSSSELEDIKPVPIDTGGINDQEEMKKQLLNFILEDFPNRYDLALAWLHEERYHDMQYTRRQASSSYVGQQPTYYDWLLRLMDGSVSTSTNPKDKTLAKVLLAAPALNNDVIEKIHSMMQQQQTTRFVMCVATLRDLATQRPPVRTRCLSILLGLCTDPDVKARSTAIAAVKRWIPLHPISKQIERHAVDTIHALLAEPPLPVIKKEEAATAGPNGATATNDTAMVAVKEEGAATKSEGAETNEQPASPIWEEQDVVRHLDLFFAVCTKKHDLLGNLFPVYTQATPPVQRYIRQHIYSLITSLGISSEALVYLVKEYQPGSETLILRILKILCDTAPSTPALRALVKDIYVRKGLRAKFMVPIFTGQVTA